MRPTTATLFAPTLIALLVASAHAGVASYKVHVPIPSLITGSTSGEVPGGGTGVEPGGDGGGGTTDPGPVDPGPTEPQVPLALLLQSTQLKNGVVGQAYSMDFASLLSATGDGSADIKPGDITWKLGTGALPAGLSLQGASVQGTPTQVTAGANFELIATYQDATGQQTYVLKVGDGIFYASKIAAGSNFTCAVTVEGGVKCWGEGANGQLGNNAKVRSNVPVDVVGLGAGSGVTAISAGAGTVCAIASGAAKCWGRGSMGQLGNNISADSAVPVDVMWMGSGVTAIATGISHTCAVASGSLKCWGFGSSGQLGNNAYANANVPSSVVVSGTVSAVAVGDSHSCAIVDGGVKCWGYALNGQLGTGGTANSSVPVNVSGLGAGSGVTAITSGANHNCAIVSAAAKCWGDGNFGKMGNNTLLNNLTPGPVTGLDFGVTAISAGGGHSCAIASGVLKCWGDGAAGQIGDGYSAARRIPAAVTGLGATVTAIDAGGAHTCAITSKGLKCWGDGTSGQLGDMKYSPSVIPVNVVDH